MYIEGPVIGAYEPLLGKNWLRCCGLASWAFRSCDLIDKGACKTEAEGPLCCQAKSPYCSVWLSWGVMQAGVKMIEGRGKIVDPHTVSVKGKNYTVCPLYLLCYAFTPCKCTNLLTLLYRELGCCCCSWSF